MTKKEQEYYKIASEASLNQTHPAVVAITKAAKDAEKILDLGCGEGTRLGNLETKGEGFGVDISDYAIKKAQKKYPEVRFIKTNIESLPFSSNFFDLVYSMFVLEHVANPEKVLRDAVRVLKNGGTFIIGAPNYGAPNRRSPNSKQGKLSKLIKDMRKKGGISLDWTRVVPTKGKYFIDADTQVEPHILSLIHFLKNLGLEIVQASSLWEIDDFSFKQLPFRILSFLKIPPFVWWGPQIFVVAKK